METLKVKLAESCYNIFIDRGIINRIGTEIKKLYTGDKIALITDKNVYSFYGEKVIESLEKEGFKVYKTVIEPGEKSKSFQELMDIYSNLISQGINRGNLIIALGGGVIGDLTGFAAATFLRGIPFVQIPTSLLAQVDSSIGGKVAVDLPQGKNLVGNFYHPKAVFIDIELLKTLPERYINDGMAEVIKYGVIKDKELFQKLMNIKTKQELFENFVDIIYSCCSIKRDIVQRDEKDNGERMLLNFGHTIGHAIEKQFKYEVFSHGEAIAIGMYAITRNSEALGITKKGSTQALLSIFDKYSLPHSFPGQKESIQDILKALGSDKKNKGSDLNFILINSIGDAFIKTVPADKAVEYVKLDY